MGFSHPLARSAGVFTAKNIDGSEYRVLAIVTTLELDPNRQNHKKALVEKLSKAAKDYLGACLDNSGLWWRRLLESDSVCL